MINLKTKTFKEKLVNAIGEQKGVIAIYQIGSSLYFDTCHDIDLAIISENNTPIYIQPFEHNKRKVNARVVSRELLETGKDLFVAELHDIKCIYGVDVIKPYDFLEHEDIWAEKKAKFERIIKFEPKRNWNYQLFLLKIAKKSHELSEEDLAKIGEACL